MVMRQVFKCAALTAATAVLASLTGCDLQQLWASNDEAPKETVAFAPGYRMAIGAGSSFPIYGLDKCPAPVPGKVVVYNGVFGRADTGKYGCVVVAPGMKTVKVVRIRNDDQVTETWQVDQDGPSLSLRTPKGETVAASNRQ